MLQKIYISNECCSFDISVYQRILEKKNIIAVWLLSSTTVFIIENWDVFEHQIILWWFYYNR